MRKLVQRWKRTEASDRRSEASGLPAAIRSPAPESTVVGRRIKIVGEVAGDEDLVIQGRVEGSVAAGSHSANVGPEGSVEGNVRGGTIVIQGEVRGDLTAEKQIILIGSASVEGDLIAPQVLLHEGTRFRGQLRSADGSAAREARAATARRSATETGPSGPESGGG